MIFCIFSFNRGTFLRNCIQSIENCAGQSKIIVFDDNSDDPETVEVLQDIKARHTLVQPGHSSQHHLGGLYGNMQSALEYCRDEDLVCYLQDDTQLVRPLTAHTITAINGAFDRLPRLGFLHPCFVKGINRSRGATYLYDNDSRLYYRAPTQRSA
ncbi:MAG: glycosyltransferase, partial [Gammaproteobacteria bacterium]|nr:glycosyltransferase [Gammaproteobacteria bacterium]